jgi:hypothetical protein|tara:strand:+ start:642 stop:851 length:210 start_codon:yes stop_codon:yes gene_type:complete
MNLDESLKALSNHESFASFIFMIRDLREECIEELHNAEFEKIQQLSGRIITYDQILKIADLKLLEKRFG